MSIRTDGADARVAIETAFGMVAHIHDRMSFQSSDSDLSAIGRLRPGERCIVDPCTATCLAAALALADESAGVFDPVLPEGGASWRDIALDGVSVTVRRPLRIDLSGIAKGHAVDRACDRLREMGGAAGLVNAGGDLRVFGAGGETVALTPLGQARPAAFHIQDGALASSDAAGSIAEYGGSQHRDGRTGAEIRAGFVSVVAPLCRDADALTKIVLALGASAAPLLATRAAVAYRHDPERGWWSIGGEA